MPVTTDAPAAAAPANTTASPPDRTTTIAHSLDSIATRGAARAWLAALLRIAALWYSVPLLYRLPHEFSYTLRQFLSNLRQMEIYPENQTTEFRLGMLHDFWESCGNNLVLLLIWAFIAWKAGRIAIWVFPLKRHCLRCGYAIGRVSKTTPATPCPECGEGQDAPTSPA